MSDELAIGHLSNGRDWRFPVPFTGRPERKRIYDWNRREWIVCTCILLGVRETPNSVPYAQRPGNEAPSAHAPTAPKTRAGTRRQAMLDFLGANKTATTAEVAKALGLPSEQASAMLAKDPLVKRVAGKGGVQRWALV